jgi:acyl-CoA synthetase (AMP-forming)/AMP-acid ligase II
MGDAGYLDESGLLWFCGRIAERVMTPDGALYTDCCEGVFNPLPGVNRTALIGLGDSPNQVPAIVIEPEPGRQVDKEQVLKLAASNPVTESIKQVFICPAFPVDVRHNAKIHRLDLAKRYNQR